MRKSFASGGKSRRVLMGLLLLFSGFCLSLDAHLNSPWGRDRALASCRCLVIASEPTRGSSLLSQLGELAIRFHQEVISPADGPRSHFFPSSSQYTLEAMRSYGFFRGVLLGCDRLMRENEEAWLYPKAELSDRTVLKVDLLPQDLFRTAIR